MNSAYVTIPVSKLEQYFDSVALKVDKLAQRVKAKGMKDHPNAPWNNLVRISGNPIHICRAAKLVGAPVVSVSADLLLEIESVDRQAQQLSDHLNLKDQMDALSAGTQSGGSVKALDELKKSRQCPEFGNSIFLARPGILRGFAQ